MSERIVIVNPNSTVAVTEGEPAPEAFVIPTGYTESPPSRLLAILRKVIGPLYWWDVPDGEVARRDKRYQELRAAVR